VRGLLIAAVCAMLASSAAVAKEPKWETRAVADKPQVLLDPAKAYVLVEAGKAGTWLTLMKTPTAAERAEDEARHEEELAKAHAKWVKKLASWEMQRKGNPQTAGLRPVEPTRASFAWAPFEQRHVVSIGPLNRFAKGERSLYLQEVEAGNYVYYGNVMVVPNGAVAGTCACMGTVAFEAVAGKIVALGKIGAPFAELREQVPEAQRPKTPLDLPQGTTSLRLDPGMPATADPRLPADKTVAASFRPVPWVPNWYGLEIDRLMPIAGVFRYDRAEQVDLTGGAASSPIR
jgi:hypothetical protein